MSIKNQDGTLNIGNIAAVIICLPVIGWLMVFTVNQYNLPSQVKELQEQVSQQGRDISAIREYLNFDNNHRKNYSSTTNNYYERNP